MCTVLQVFFFAIIYNRIILRLEVSQYKMKMKDETSKEIVNSLHAEYYRGGGQADDEAGEDDEAGRRAGGRRMLVRRRTFSRNSIR